MIWQPINILLVRAATFDLVHGNALMYLVERPEGFCFHVAGLLQQPSKTFNTLDEAKAAAEIYWKLKHGTS